ncbi:hypothetical protein A2U01_0100849, partial [Trifolium medium]|nr:hypothetical protein [Trifolium medium]
SMTDDVVEVSVWFWSFDGFCHFDSVMEGLRVSVVFDYVVLVGMRVSVVVGGFRCVMLVLMVLVSIL